MYTDLKRNSRAARLLKHLVAKETGQAVTGRGSSSMRFFVRRAGSRGLGKAHRLCLANSLVVTRLR